MKRGKIDSGHAHGGGDGIASPRRAWRGRPCQHHLLAGALDTEPYLSGGTKELEAASLVLEPLARYDQDGNMVPWLAQESVPTVDNGGVSADLTTITWKLKEGLVWVRRQPRHLSRHRVFLGVLHPSGRRLRAERKIQ